MSREYRDLLVKAGNDYGEALEEKARGGLIPHGGSARFARHLQRRLNKPGAIGGIDYRGRRNRIKYASAISKLGTRKRGRDGGTTVHTWRGVRFGHDVSVVGKKPRSNRGYPRS